jgi:hypothetical protein
MLQAVSEYTDNVDILSGVHKNHRILAQIRDICAILSGLLVACDYRAGQRLVSDKDFKDNAEFFQDLFEIARRHKVCVCLCACVLVRSTQLRRRHASPIDSRRLFSPATEPYASLPVTCTRS